MKRPAFQFYPADWRSNGKLRRCSEAARGVWMDVLCLLHDSDEYGICRWPLSDIARASGVPIRLLKELADKGVLKGGDDGCESFIYTPRHAGRDGEPVVLIEATASPCWYCSRFVKDEHKRLNRGKETQFTPENQPPKPAPKPPIGARQGDGSSSASSSTTAKLLSVAKEEVVDFWNSQSELPKIQSLTAGRIKHLKARTGELFFSMNWKSAIHKLLESPFLTGTNDRGWRADFDWFIKPDSVPRIMEGKYDQKAPAKTHSHANSYNEPTDLP